MRLTLCGNIPAIPEKPLVPWEGGLFQMKIDWKSFLSQHDLIYEQAPKIWADGFPIGNGALGAVVYAPFHPEWIINKNDVYDYRKPKLKLLKHSDYLNFLKKDGTPEGLDRLEEHHGAADFPTPKTCATLRIAFGRDSTWNGPHGIKQRLCLHEATVRTDLDKHMSHPRIESFVHRNSNILAIRLKDVSWAGPFQNSIELFRHQDCALLSPLFGASGDLIWLEQKMPDGFRYAVVARIVPKGGKAWKDWIARNVRSKFRPEPSKKVGGEVVGERVCAAVAGDLDIFVSVVTSLESSSPLDEAKALANLAAEKGYDRLHREHRAWWASFWKKSFVKLDNPFLEQLWYFSLYQLASSYGKVPVPGLCSLWYGPDDKPVQVLPWLGTYTNDQNSQMPPMPLFSSNHPELIESFYETFNRMIPTVQKQTKELTGLNGIWLPLSTDPTGRFLFGGRYRYIHVGGPYHGVVYSLGYRYTSDPELLRKYIYPFLREVCIFFSEYMSLDEKTGRYRLWPSVPAEEPFPGSANPTQTLALLKVCLKQAIEAAEILNLDPEWVIRWKDLLAKFPDYPVDRGIILEAEDIPYDHYTSQFGALYTVFPAGEIDAQSPPEVRALVRRTFDSYKWRFTMRSYADAKGSHFFNGWTWFFADMIALRMGWKKEAWELFWNQPLRCHLKPNGLFTHNAFAIADPKRSEANLRNIPKKKVRDRDEWMPLSEPMHSNSGGGSECTPALETKETVFPVHEMSSAYLTFINETLLQSHNGIVRLFPCVPSTFTGAFQDMRAEGAFLVSSRMKRGVVQFARVKSLAGGTLRLRNPWPKKKVSLSRGGRAARIVSGKEFHLNTRKGEVLTFYADRRALREATALLFRGERKASPKCIRFKDGSRAWLGKPEPSVYYAP